MPVKLGHMKTLLRALTLGAVLLPAASRAFIPPVKDIVETVFSNRKPNAGTEFHLTHNVQVQGGQQVGVDEKIFVDGALVQVLWKVAGATIGAQWERQSYVAGGGATMSSRSSGFMRYLVAATGEEFLRALLNEQFVNKEQLTVFNSGYQPKGEPNTWKTKSFYKLHDTIFFSRVGSGTAIAVVGLDEGAVRKAVYFDDDLKGVSRLEWREGSGTTSWDFAGFSRAGGPGGLFPKRMTFTYQGVERITSALQGIRVLKGNSLAEFKKTYQGARSAGVPSSAEPALKVLLSYR